jgi:DNA-binding transcriptional LysR family regulator
MAEVTMEWESRLGRRLRVRDLYILSNVVKSRSMAKAARQLAMSQPAVSEAIANLEHVLGVRLLDRSPRGVEATIYGNAMLKRSVAVFDELKQSVKDIEFLSDPTTGHLTIGCPESIAATELPWIAERFSKQYPRVVLQVEDVPSPAIQSLGELRGRRFDLILARWPIPLSRGDVVDDLNVETLVDDPLIVAAGMHTRWAHRRKIDLAELADEPWILAPPRTWNYEWVAEAFEARGLGAPKVILMTFNAHLNAHFLKTGPFLTAYPRSWARLNSFKVLPVNLPLRPWPLSLVTLKDRTLSPAVERFIECAREVGRWVADLEKLGSPAYGSQRSKVG